MPTTARFTMLLRDGTQFETTDLDANDVAEYQRLYDHWKSGSSGGADINYTKGGLLRKFSFEYEDIVRIDLTS